jgi:hypothetical protein
MASKRQLELMDQKQRLNTAIGEARGLIDDHARGEEHRVDRGQRLRVDRVPPHAYRVELSPCLLGVITKEREFTVHDSASVTMRGSPWPAIVISTHVVGPFSRMPAVTATVALSRAFDQRAAAAFLAIPARSSGVSTAARACPPFDARSVGAPDSRAI